MRVIGHRDDRRCPRCNEDAYCEDCGSCANCDFAAPDVAGQRCGECHETVAHAISCSVTRKAAAS